MALAVRFILSVIVCTVLLLVLAQISSPGLAQEPIVLDRRPQPSRSHEQLPPPRAHPLPASLAQWQDRNHAGDYFSEIQPTPIGYLVWSQFPVTVFVEPALTTGNVAAIERSQAWVEAVQQAVQEWNAYLPLQWTTEAETADIAIWRSTPPLQLEPRQEQSEPDPLLRLPRARSAETRYHLFVDRPVDAPAKISHRFTIHITPNQTIEYLKATARHEMGHALGIWGHSPLETDALYFSQVRTSPPISDRDINTLKRIYQQPTQIGWELP